MSDNKRPLGDFSQTNNEYNGVSTTLNGKSVLPEDFTPNLQPSSLFSNNPINKQAPGTFANNDKPTIRAVRFGGEILNKKEPALTIEQKELASKKEKLQTTISSLFIKYTLILEDINNPSYKSVQEAFDPGVLIDEMATIKEDIDRLKDSVGSVQSIEEIDKLEKRLGVNETNLQNVKNAIDDAVEDVFKKIAILEALEPLKNRFITLSTRANEIYKKTDQQTAAKILDLLSSLNWLAGDQAQKKDIITEDISKELSTIEDAIDREESSINQKEIEEATKQQEILSLFKELIPLVGKYGALKKDAEGLLLSNIDDAQKETLQNKINELGALNKQVEDNPTRESVDLFNEELNEYSTLIEEGASFKKEQIDPRGVWSGWPESRFISRPGEPKNGILPYLVFAKEDGNFTRLNPAESEFWLALKTNFTTIFKEYDTFLKKDDTAKKIKELPDLIASKNAAVEGILSEDIGEAASLIEVFRIKLAEVKDGWDTKIKKEAEDNIIKQEKNETKKKLLEEFNWLKKLHTATTSLYQEAMSKITSEEERAFITKYYTGLITQSGDLDALFTNPDKEVTLGSLENFKLGINEFADEIAKIEKRLVTIETRKGGRITPPLRTSFNGSNKDKTITLRNGTSMRVEDWEKQQAAKYPHQNQSTEQTEGEKLETFNKVLAQHKDMYLKNKKTYLELYSHKNWVSGDINKKASEEMLTRQLADLTKAKDSSTQEIETLTAKLSTDSEEEKISISSQLEGLKQRLQLTKEEIRLINEISYNQKIAFYKNQDTAKSIRRMKEVYSPAQDASLSKTSTPAPTKGLFQTIRIASAAKKEGYISEEERTLQKEQLELYRNYTAEIESIKERIRRGTSENIDADLLQIDEIKNKINLLIKEDAPQVSMIEQKSANHYSGMVRSLNEEEAALKLGAYPVPNQIVINNPEEVIHREANSSEQVQKKRTMVGTLFETLTKNNGKKYLNDWKVWAVALTVAGGGLTTLVPHRNENQVKSPQTLEQMMSWRDPIQEENIKEFTADFLDKKIGFEEIIKKYAPSVQFNSANLESLKKMNEVKPYDLFNDNTKEHIFELSPEGRKELSQVTLYLQTLVQATEAKNRMKPNFKQNDYSIAPPEITMENYFREVFGIVTKVDQEEKKLKK